MLRLLEAEQGFHTNSSPLKKQQFCFADAGRSFAEKRGESRHAAPELCQPAALALGKAKHSAILLRASAAASKAKQCETYIIRKAKPDDEQSIAADLRQPGTAKLSKRVEVHEHT